MFLVSGSFFNFETYNHHCYIYTALRLSHICSTTVLHLALGLIDLRFKKICNLAASWTPVSSYVRH